MTSSNRVQVAFVRESTPGTTPGTPRMRTARITSEGLTFTPDYSDPDEIRADRMMGDPILQMQAAQGPVSFELSYPVDDTFLSDVIRSAMFNTWANTPTFDNDGTADSVVTDAGTTTDTYVVASGGAAVVVGHLVRATGFTNGANNQIFRAASSTSTTIVGSSLSLTAETAPPATAKLKVVGFQGASGDITATAGGLGSSSLDFTTLGLAVGQWIKVGGTAAGDQFATAALNGWARITAIAANALTLDNKPIGWTTDAGTSKTIKVWFGDTIKNGTTKTALSIEKGFLGQDTPSYIVGRGLVAGTLEMSAATREKITGTVTFTGMGGGESTTPLDASPDAVTTGRVMAGNANVGRIAEAGAAVAAKNWAQSLNFTINNNLRTLEAADDTSPVGIEPGECQVSGQINTYYGDDTLLAKLYAGTPTSINTRFNKDSQAVIWTFPRVTFRGGAPVAGGKNQDVMLALDWQSSLDTATSAHVMCDRLEYYE